MLHVFIALLGQKVKTGSYLSVHMQESFYFYQESVILII